MHIHVFVPHLLLSLDLVGVGLREVLHGELVEDRRHGHAAGVQVAVSVDI